jgi:hypothetical protein
MILRIACAILSLSLNTAASDAQGQQKIDMPANSVHLELTAEVAATDDEGIPSAMRIILKNIGDTAVDLPVPNRNCPWDGGVAFKFNWTSRDHSTGYIETGDCGATDEPPLIERVHQDWVRLRPGEFLTSTENLRHRFTSLGSGTVDYWVKFTPPMATPEEVSALKRTGYCIPTESIETPHRTFTIH